MNNELSKQVLWSNRDMFRLFCTSLFVAIVVMSFKAQAGEDRRTVEFMMNGCRYLALKPAPVRDAEWTEAFNCRDALKIIVANGRLQPKFLASCVPDNLQDHDIARAVVQILDRNPERFKERFDIRASTALHEVWPCPN